MPPLMTSALGDAVVCGLFFLTLMAGCAGVLWSVGRLLGSN